MKKTFSQIFLITFFATIIFCANANAGKTGAAIALPFAFMGDTVIAPFQVMGYTGRALIDQGNAAGSYTKYSSFTYEYNEPSFVQLVFYIPGFIMAPFMPLANFPYYPMTTSCIKQFSVNDEAYRRQRTMY